MAVLDVNSQGEAYRVGAALKLGVAQGFLTDANVTAADTVAGLKTAVTNAVPKAEVAEVNRQQLLKAINVGASLGLLTDAAILNLTTAAALIALTGIPSTYTARAFYE
jgi:predicted amidohydrolase YtcJ